MATRLRSASMITAVLMFSPSNWANPAARLVNFNLRVQNIYHARLYKYAAALLLDFRDSADPARKFFSGPTFLRRMGYSLVGARAESVHF